MAVHFPNGKKEAMFEPVEPSIGISVLASQEMLEFDQDRVVFKGQTIPIRYMPAWEVEPIEYVGLESRYNKMIVVDGVKY